MISVNVIDGNIVGSYGDTPYSVTYSPALYKKLVNFSEEADIAHSVDDYNSILYAFKAAIKEDFTKLVQDKCEYIFIKPSTKEFFLKGENGVSSVPMPQALVDRIYESLDAGIDFMPLVKMWTRWLRNPILYEKQAEGKGAEFSNRFFNFINMKYVHPALKTSFMEEHGLSEEVAERKATMYQMKITKEGLLNGYKVSKEVLTKYDTETGEEMPRYTRTFNPDTGEIDSEGLPDTVEERLFEPAVMGDRGDAFYCEGTNGYQNAGHFIKVGCTHRLESWDLVNTNDEVSCVPGLHVGGLKYISWYSGEIHNVFIDPMHVGAVPDDVDGAIRCLQYFVHSSLVGVNGSIYHSSTYASMTDEEWGEMREEAIQSAQASLDQLNSIG
jgi:hypothetical protein